MSAATFERIRHVAARHDSFDLLVSLAALQLLPENVSFTIRLEAATHAAAAGPRLVGVPSVTPSELAALCANEPVAAFDVVRYEDPPETHFTEPFGWSGSAYTVLPGIADDSAFTLRQLCAAIRLLPEFFSQPEFISEATSLLTAALIVGDAVAKQAGYERWTEPRVVSNDVTIPSYERLRELRSAVCFSRDDVTRLLGPDGLAALPPLITPFGTEIHWNGPRDGSLIAAPIVQCEDQFVVALPSMLLESTRHEVIVRAVEANVVGDLSERFLRAGWATVKECFHRLDHGLAFEGPLHDGALHNIREALFHHDVDKLTQVVLVADPLHEHRRGTVFGRWDLGETEAAVNTRLEQIERRLLQRRAPPSEVLTIVTFLGAGYAYTFRGPHLQGRIIPFRCAELEQVSFIEGGESLALSKYAAAQQRARAKMEVVRTSQLDEFAFYRAHRHSYYMSDEAPPNGAFIEVGMGLSVRTDVANRYDPHPVARESGRQLTNTARLLGAGVPVFADLARMGHVPAVVVEGFPLPIWITGAVNRSVRGASYGLVAELVQGLGYWMWQFTPGLARVFEHAPIAERSFHIQLEAAADILPQFPGSAVSDHPPFTTATDRDDCQVHVRINREAVPLLSTADNRGERTLMRELLKACREVLPHGMDLLTDAEITRLVDAHAPLGQKKHFFFLNVDQSPDLDASHLPHYRPLQESDVDALLDDLGAHFREQLNRPTGEIREQDCHQVLNDAVAYFYGRLRDAVAELSPSGLVEYLLAAQERNVYESAFRRLTVPTRLACFSDVPETVKTLRDEMAQLPRVNLASRFLIEYVAATPPSGNTPMSIATYDLLLALSHHIVNFGFSSDTVRLNLSNPSLSILGSGRLGVSNDEYQEGLATFFAAFSSDAVARATRKFHEHWRQGGSRELRSLEDMDQPARAEFGMSLADMLDFLIAAINVWRPIANPIAAVTETEFVERLAGELSWTSERVDAALQLFVLERRGEFLNPPAPFRTRDVYPWKFSRSLSYLRRPFVRVVRPTGTAIVFGPRHVFMAAAYLLDLCYSGRLVATSPQMRAAMSALNDQRGKTFNEKVADVMRQKITLTVRSRIRQFGHLHIPKDLGDLDVLAIDPLQRNVQVIECKDLALARTPDELSHQLDALLPKDDHDKGAAVVRHSRRIEWVREHIAEILDHFKLPSDPGWKVEGLFVVDEPLLVPHLREVTLPVVALEALYAEDRSG